MDEEIHSVGETRVDYKCYRSAKSGCSRMSQDRDSSLFSIHFSSAGAVDRIKEPAPFLP